MTKWIAIGSMVLMACVSYAQSHSQFEVASIKKAEPRQSGYKAPIGPQGGPGTSSGTSTCTKRRLTHPIYSAYGVPPLYVRGKFSGADGFMQSPGCNGWLQGSRDG